MSRKLAGASCNDAHRGWCPSRKDRQGVIEAIELFESGWLVERRTSSDHRTPSDTSGQRERNRQGVLPSLGPTHDTDRPHFEVVKKRHEIASDPEQQTKACQPRCAVDAGPVGRDHTQSQ